MNYFENKTAFVTGAASGIGLAITKALVSQGANVMMSDVNAEGLDLAAKQIGNAEQVATVVCNVAEHESVLAASKATIKRVGKVHLLFNNAGVSLAGKNGAIAVEDWRWIIDINVMGVVNGIETFLPLSQSHDEGGHIINTASMAGHATAPFMAPYHASKFAVVGYSESLQQDLKDTNVGVSVLCPTWVKSNIYNAPDGAPSQADTDQDFSDSQVYQMTKQLVDNGMSAEDFAALVLSAVEQKRFYVFNDREARAAIDVRRDHILSDYDACLAEIEA